METVGLLVIHTVHQRTTPFTIWLSRTLTHAMAHNNLLEGKIAAITGGSRGIGLATARTFAEAGATVLLAASVFHFGMIAIPDLKDFLRDKGYEVKA